jgi:hypothetical protein
MKTKIITSLAQVIYKATVQINLMPEVTRSPLNKHLNKETLSTSVKTKSV